MSEHALVRATVTPQIVTILSKYYGIGLDEALRRFYESKTAANYADDETGLYGQSALYIAGMFIMEQDGQIDEKRLYAATRPDNSAASV
ncbi:MAG: hypothetical protein PUC15_07740 [Lentisphaeria bacterium]|nr:hypothetical protein [Lentisphaeria bacterium]MDD6338256.1 hypothetical protein [Lentisphaeria bacterium]